MGPTELEHKHNAGKKKKKRNKKRSFPDQRKKKNSKGFHSFFNAAGKQTSKSGAQQKTVLDFSIQSEKPCSTKDNPDTVGNKKTVWAACLINVFKSNLFWELLFFFFFFTFIVLHYKSIILNPQAAHLHLMGNLWMWMMQADQHGILYVKNCQYWLLHQERELHCCLSNMRQNTRYQRADTYKRKLLQLVLWRLVKFQDDKHDLCSSVWFLANCEFLNCLSF